MDMRLLMIMIIFNLNYLLIFIIIVFFFVFFLFLFFEGVSQELMCKLITVFSFVSSLTTQQFNK